MNKIKPGGRHRKPAATTYYRVSHARPLGHTPAVRAILHKEGLWDIVTPELREVYYYRVDERKHRKDFCAIGWPNEQGGWEIRHPRYTGCLGQKGLTLVADSKDRVLVFPDMCSYLCWRYRHRDERPSLIILNDPAQLPHARELAGHYPQQQFLL